MASTAENLQEFEHHGHRWASALLVHAGERADAVRAAALRFMWGHAQDGARPPSYWREASQRVYGCSCAFMAGVELAIEQHEATHGHT